MDTGNVSSLFKIESSPRRTPRSRDLALSEGNLADVESMISRLEVKPFDSQAAIHFGQIRADLAKTGRPIRPYDAMIAGHGRRIRVSNHQSIHIVRLRPDSRATAQAWFPMFPKGLRQTPRLS